MQVLKPEKIITTISNLKTGEEYKTEEEYQRRSGFFKRSPNRMGRLK